MPFLVFVDDDESERVAMEGIATKGGYEYEGIPWPPGSNDPFNKFTGNPPDIFVLDLYLPPRNGSALERISAEKCAIQSVMAKRAAMSISKLYDQPCAGREKALLQETMKCLLEVRELLDSQWRAMGQDPQNGIDLLKDLRGRFTQVPVVFYSRKITPEDVIRVLQTGPADSFHFALLEASV